MSRLWDFLPSHLTYRRPGPRPCYQPPLRLHGVRASSSLHDWLAADMAGWCEPPIPLEEADTARMRRTARLTRPLPPVTYHTRPLWIVDALTERREVPHGRR